MFEDSEYAYKIDKDWYVVRWNPHPYILYVEELFFHIPCSIDYYMGGSQGHCLSPEYACSTCKTKPPKKLIKKAKVMDQVKGYILRC
jgi:hypothetical protein